MNLHLVLRHPKNPVQKFKNRWLDADRPSSIETTKEIGDLCAEMMAKGEAVFIHRCRFKESEPKISCNANVIESSTVLNKTIVKFSNHKLMGVQPAIKPPRGTNFYWLK